MARELVEIDLKREYDENGVMDRVFKESNRFSIMEKDVALREWFSDESKRWIEIMNEKDCHCTRPMFFVRDHEDKSLSIMVFTDGLKFSEFVGANVRDLIKNGKENDAPMKGIGYFFHTDEPADERCPVKTAVHMVGFSPDKDGILDHVHAEVCVNKKDNGESLVDVTVFPKGGEQFHISMKPLFENPFFPPKPGDPGKEFLEI